MAWPKGVPRGPRTASEECKTDLGLQHFHAIDHDALHAEVEHLRDLIRWLAPRIERRNGNGMISDQLCLLCVLGQPQFKRQPCRHAEIWTIGRGV
jgi:hypothetical protein